MTLFDVIINLQDGRTITGKVSDSDIRLMISFGEDVFIRKYKAIVKNPDGTSFRTADYFSFRELKFLKDGQGFTTPSNITLDQNDFIDIKLPADFGLEIPDNIPSPLPEPPKEDNDIGIPDPDPNLPDEEFTNPQAITLIIKDGRYGASTNPQLNSVSVRLVSRVADKTAVITKPVLIIQVVNALNQTVSFMEWDLNNLNFEQDFKFNTEAETSIISVNAQIVLGDSLLPVSRQVKIALSYDSTTIPNPDPTRPPTQTNNFLAKALGTMAAIGTTAFLYKESSKLVGKKHGKKKK